MIYYAKTDGKTTIENHVTHLQDERSDLLSVRSFAIEKYRERTGKNLDKMLFRAILWHDEGKKDSEWQDHCKKNTLHLVKVRHELVSLCAIHRDKIDASDQVRVAIAAHHGKLGWKYEDKWRTREEFIKLNLWGQFRRLGDRINGIEESVRTRYEYDGPRGWLQLCDHRASAKENGSRVPKFRSFAYTFPYGDSKRGVQKMIEDLEIWKQPFAILRAPTGSGKTDAALIWAQKQIQEGKADRLVIAMPTRFTANSLAISKPEEISSSGLYHSTSQFVHSKHSSINYLDRQYAEWEQILARTLETPITVTTIDHLCISLTATREDHHTIFFNMANSCVVIDEADFYDNFTQNNMIVLLRALRELKVPVLMMSATVPESARQLYSDGNRFVIPPIYEDKSDIDRPRCRLTRQGSVCEPQEIAHLLERALNGEPTIIYANTVKRAQAYYRWFKKQNKDFTEKSVILYHSRFTEPHKAKKEELVLEMLGKEAWKNGAAHGVAILTQIGELSVNISSDFMISDLCPADRLAQRVGRLSRFGEQMGEVFVLDPYNSSKSGERAPYPAPYGALIARKWVASEALVKSGDLLKEGEYTARDFVRIVDLVYPNVTELTSKVRDNRKCLEDMMSVNWLLLPQEDKKGNEGNEEDRTENWRSRDVQPQKTLYVDTSLSNSMFEGAQKFERWTEFRRFQLEHGVQCHVFEFARAIEQGILLEDRDKQPVIIVEDSDFVWTVPKAYYDFETGLCLDRVSEDEDDE